MHRAVVNAIAPSSSSSAFWVRTNSSFTPPALPGLLKAVVEPALNANEHDLHFRDEFLQDRIDLFNLVQVPLLERRGDFTQPHEFLRVEAMDSKEPERRRDQNLVEPFELLAEWVPLALQGRVRLLLKPQRTVGETNLEVLLMFQPAKLPLQHQ